MQVMAGARHGGAEAFFERLVPALSRAGLDQHAAIRTHPARAGKLSAAGVPIAQFRFGSPLDLATGLGLWRLARRFRPDIVMTWMNRATRFCPPGRFLRIARLGGYYDPKYYRSCDHLVANTEDIAAHLRDAGFAPDRVHVLPNFVDATPADPVSRRSLHTPADAPVVLAMGRLHANKGFDTLIRAMARLPAAYLWLAGAGPEREALVRQAEGLAVKHRIRFLGWRDDIPALLRAADMLACPSRHEPLGNVVLEAWAHGVPVVAAASQGPRALITDGVDGLPVPVDDADALAGAIRLVLEDAALAGRLAAAGQGVYRAKFSEAAVVRAYLELFHRLIAGPATATLRPLKTDATPHP